MQDQTATIDGVRMRWCVREGSTGRGLPVVLVHGIPTSPALWRDVFERVSGARLLAWEMVGYGRSIPEGEGRDLSIARQAAYLRSWMDALELRRAVLVGHDLGGGVLQIAALEDPGLCAGLVLTNSIGYDSWPIPSVRAMRALSRVTDRLPDRVLASSLKVLLRRGHDDAAKAKESWRIHLSPYLEHGDGAPRGATALFHQISALDTRDTLAIADRLPELRGRPARVVWGAADPFQKVKYGQRFADDLGCELIRIEGGKHFVPEDHPEELAAAIREVVAEVQARELPIAAEE